MSTTRAAVLRATGGRLAVEELNLRAAGPGEVVVRLLASGLCHSDVGVIDGSIPASLPVVLGHEGAGVVEEVGPGVRSVALGETVVLSGIPSCGACFYCVRGQAVLCERSQEVWERAGAYTDRDGAAVTAMYGLGAFSELATVSELCVIPVRSTLPPEQLAILGCAAITGVGAAVNVARVRAGSSVVVIGCGGVGQCMVQGALIAGAAEVIAVDPLAFKRETAQRLGATHAIDPGSTDALAAVRELTGGRGADYVMEGVGSAATFELAYAMTRPGGICVLAGGSVGPEVRFSLPVREVALSAKQIRSARYGDGQMRRDIPALARMAELGRLDLASLVTSTRPLAEIQNGFDDLACGAEIRTVVLHG